MPQTALKQPHPALRYKGSQVLINFLPRLYLDLLCFTLGKRLTIQLIHVFYSSQASCTTSRSTVHTPSEPGGNILRNYSKSTLQRRSWAIQAHKNGSFCSCANKTMNGFQLLCSQISFQDRTPDSYIAILSILAIDALIFDENCRKKCKKFTFPRTKVNFCALVNLC